jgi:hypothetical protein
LWSTRPTPDAETGVVVIANSIAFHGSSVFLAGYSGKLGYIIVASFRASDGVMEWENKEIVSSNSHMFTTHLLAAPSFLAAPGDNSLYLLGFSGLPTIDLLAASATVSAFEDSNDFVMKINATSGAVLWSQQLSVSSTRHDLTFRPFTSIYSYISFASQNSDTPGASAASLLYVSGQYHNYATGGSHPVAQLRFCNNGSLYQDLTHTSPPIHTIAYTESSYKHDSYRTVSAENAHFYGTDEAILGSLILKNRCPDGYYLQAKTETTSVGAPCRGISWSLQEAEGTEAGDHSLTCSYLFGGVETAGLVLIFLLPALASLIAASFAHISVLSICLVLLAAVSLSSDLAYLSSHLFFDSLSFGLCCACLALPLLPYAAFMRSHTAGRTYRHLPLLDDPTFPRALAALLWIRHLLYYFYLYCLGYLLYLLCLLPHPPVQELLFSFLFTPLPSEEDAAGGGQAQGQPLASGASSKVLTSSLLFTSLSLLLCSFVPTLICQSLNSQLMAPLSHSHPSPEVEQTIVVISTVSKALFLLALVNYIFYSYGTAALSVLWASLMTITSLSVFTALQFQEIDEEAEAGNPAAAAVTSPGEVELYQKRIRDLESQLERLTKEQPPPPSSTDTRYRDLSSDNY